MIFDRRRGFVFLAAMFALALAAAVAWHFAPSGGAVHHGAIFYDSLARHATSMNSYTFWA